MIISKDEATQILQPFLETIESCIANAITEYNSISIDKRIKFTKRTKASIINDFIVFNAADELPKLSGVLVSTSRRPFSVYLGEKFKLRFKKFDYSLRPSYIATQQMLNLINQVSIPMPDMPQQVTHVIAGYVWQNKAQTKKDIYITCPNGKQNEWELKITIVKAPTFASDEVGSVNSLDNRRVFPKDIDSNEQQ